MQKWEQPKVVKLEALPEVLGACVGGGTFRQGNCSVGNNPSNKCVTGGIPQP